MLALPKPAPARMALSGWAMIRLRQSGRGSRSLQFLLRARLRRTRGSSQKSINRINESTDRRIPSPPAYFALVARLRRLKGYAGQATKNEHQKRKTTIRINDKHLNYSTYLSINPDHVKYIILNWELISHSSIFMFSIKAV